MIIRTYFDKNNTIVSGSTVNTGKNPVAELFYGGHGQTNNVSRLIFYFDETNLKKLHNDGTYPDLSKLKHTLRMTNTGSFDKSLLNTSTCGGKERASSFNLILFEINQKWDEGTGYDHNNYIATTGDNSRSTKPSNWIEAQTITAWSGETNSDINTSLKEIHFEDGNENIDLDISDIVNGYITGNTNNGLGIAFERTLEKTKTYDLQYVGFFTRHTHTIYEPHVETIYDLHIKDDRANFYLDKQNKLYLYVNLGGEPTNLDLLPNVDILNNNGDIIINIPPSGVTHVTKGVYSVDVQIPSSSVASDCFIFNDVWRNITVNGVVRPDVMMDFALIDDNKYYNIGNNDNLPKKYAFNVSGINREEKIKRGDIRRVTVTARIPYTTNQTSVIDGIQYRLYVKEGRNELTIIDFQDVERAYNSNYFLLHTESLLPSTYYLDVKVTSNNEVTTIKETITFDIVSQSDLRISQ